MLIVMLIVDGTPDKRMEYGCLKSLHIDRLLSSQIRPLRPSLTQFTGKEHVHKLLRSHIKFIFLNALISGNIFMRNKTQIQTSVQNEKH